MSKPTPEQLEKAHTDLAQAYLESLLQIMSFTDQDEVNFMKKTVETPNGGIYLLQFQHVSGPKINLKEDFK